MYSTPVECPQVHPSIVLYVQQDPLLCLRVTDYNIRAYFDSATH